MSAAVKAVLPLGLLFVVPFNPTLLSDNNCFSRNFYGNYRDGDSTVSVTVARLDDAACTEFWSNEVDEASLSAAPEAGRSAVWLERAAMEEGLVSESTASDTLDDLLESLNRPVQEYRGYDSAGGEEIVLKSEESGLQPGYTVHYRTEHAALVSLDSGKALAVDTLLPPFWKSKLLPSTPVSYIPVPDSATDAVRSILSDLKFDPVVASIVGNISIPQIKKDIRHLTGEDESSGIISRHSFSDGAIVAAEWLKARVEETGASCTLAPFLTGFAPNVICRYEAVEETNATVLISGHYDSRGSFGSTRAPGGDDDGSGTVGVLSIARVIGRKGVKFHSNVELAFFAGEEQGLLGSRAYARELREAGANLTLMVQADMTAYRAPGEPLQLGLPARIGTPEVTQLVANISAIYSPELHVGITTACCSDHQSFHEQGFPATQVFERAGSIADPMYHNSGDLSDREGYDFEQLFAIAKVQFATVLHTAGYEL
ncbi:Zn-dependent exopeptidase [Pholiota conissans]|uniref:Peptide hydrolase n=1 Tax=Pholiota conissans TaxID=109636 RepID=A0A9P5Z0Y0_9AGAR|nr:Zn-dependent exopeptidase [Pholiota conissans]